MSIRADQLLVCEPLPSGSLLHFIEFWSERYHWPDEHVYTENIKGLHTAEGLLELLWGEIGPRFFDAKRGGLERHFGSRFDESSESSPRLSGHEQPSSAALL